MAAEGERNRSVLRLENAKAVSRLDTLLCLKKSLDEDPSFKTKLSERISSNGAGSTLLRLLQLVPDEPTDFPLPLLNTFLPRFQLNDNGNSFCFLVSGQQMNVTLEDVLFLTHLPIKGIPLVPEVSRDRKAFERVFSVTGKKISLANLRGICADRNREDDTRIKAICLLIVSCIIAPDDSGSYCSTSYVQFVEDLDNVDKYAWGAAMLAFLYQGLRQWKNKDKTIDGFAWLIMGFFFYHFKGLYEIFGIAQEQQPEMPLLASLIKALAKVGANHHWKINDSLYEKLKEVNELLEPPKKPMIGPTGLLTVVHS